MSPQNSATASDWRTMLHTDLASTAERRMLGSLRSLHALRIGEKQFLGGQSGSAS